MQLANCIGERIEVGEVLALLDGIDGIDDQRDLEDITGNPGECDSRRGSSLRTCRTSPKRRQAVLGTLDRFSNFADQPLASVKSQERMRLYLIYGQLLYPDEAFDRIKTVFPQLGLICLEVSLHCSNS